MNTYNTFSKLIDDNEKILWYGKQASNKLGLFYVLIPIIWFVVSIMVLVPLAKISYWLLFIAIPFCFIEAVFLERADRLSPRNQYCVTNNRLIVKKGRELKTRELTEVSAITLEKINKKRGSLVFEQLDKDKKSSYGDFRFYNIKDYVSVYKIVSDARDKKKKILRREK